MSKLLVMQKVLLVNWIVVPVLGLSILSQKGFLSVVLFILAWLMADKIWDWLTQLLIAGVSQIGANEREAFQIEISGEVPLRMAIFMIIDLLGTLILPAFVAGFF